MKSKSITSHKTTTFAKLQRIKLVLTDCDGVLTDTGVYYSETGEVMKRFSIRDGMGVERLRKMLNIETGIVTGESSPSVKKRAENLKLKELHLDVKNKTSILKTILQKHNFNTENVAFIGDDMNDLEIMKLVGFSACPSDAIDPIKKIADYVCREIGGHGAFRELAELIIDAKSKRNK